MVKNLPAMPEGGRAWTVEKRGVPWAGGRPRPNTRGTSSLAAHSLEQRSKCPPGTDTLLYFLMGKKDILRKEL